MKTRWFGEAWPDPSDPAAVCEDTEYAISVPTGYRCIYCDQWFDEDDRGVVMAYGGPWKEDYTFGVIGPDTEGQDVISAAEHLECMLYSILGYDPRRAHE